jgi:hypothetical protein
MRKVLFLRDDYPHKKGETATVSVPQSYRLIMTGAAMEIAHGTPETLRTSSAETPETRDPGPEPETPAPKGGRRGPSDR